MSYLIDSCNLCADNSFITILWMQRLKVIKVHLPGLPSCQIVNLKSKTEAESSHTVLLLLHVCHAEAPQVHRGHAESELADGPPLPQPVREPGQVAVTVQVVGVQAPGSGEEGRGCHRRKWGGCHWQNAVPPPCSFAQHDHPRDPRGELPSAMQTATGSSTLLLLTHK